MALCCIIYTVAALLHEIHQTVTYIVFHKDYFATVYLCGVAVGLRDVNVFQELVLPLQTTEVE